MELLWPSIGIGVVVGFVFFVLAKHWQRILGQYSWTIRRLAERVRDLEEMADPEFRRRLGEAAPVPLEQVLTLTFRLNDRFWRDALHMTEENLRFIREFGSFVGSVKLDRWRSHTVATVAEVLPDRKETGWQMRSLDFFPDPTKIGRGLSLWELGLSRSKFSTERPPSLELVLRENSVDLLGHLVPREDDGDRDGGAYEEILFFRVPLNTNELAEFRSHDPSNEAINGGENSDADQILADAAWQAFYSGGDEALGIEWQLRLRDLNRKSEWDRWKIIEPATAPLGARRRYWQ
jgi:hypothetical protein